MTSMDREMAHARVDSGEDASLHRRRWLLISVLLAAMLGAAAGSAWTGRQSSPETAWGTAPPRVRAVIWPEPQPLAEFNARTQHGNAVGREIFEGRWSFVSFGYLRCPDVCPMSLRAMREMRELLVERQPAANDYLFVFVSVDPRDDDPAGMRGYLARHAPPFVGLVGSAADIGKLAASMAVKHRQIDGGPGDGVIDHTSSVLVVDPQGRMVGALPPPLYPARMVEQFEQLRAYLAHR